VPVNLLNFAWHRLEWPPAEMLAGGGWDVAHSMHPLLMPARAAAQVVTIYDLNFLTHPERTRGEIRRDYPALAREHAQRADQVIVISEFTAREVRERLDVSPDRMSICPPGHPGWAPRRGAPAKDAYLLFLGTLEPRKNVGALLDAYERLGDRRALPPLVLAGKATERSDPWLQRISRAPLAGLVRHIGYVAPERRQGLYASALALVQPSFEEGFGMPVLEAMSVGVPVIASNRGALPEVVGDAGALFDPDDSDALAGAIERLIDDPAEAAAAAVRGIARSRLFTWTAMAAKTMTAYQAAIESRAARGAA
jgi:glycosyltransferase involved in cell wall biosynthesis